MKRGYTELWPIMKEELESLRLIVKYQGHLTPTVGGMLLFCKDRELIFPDAWIQCGRFIGKDKADIYDHIDIHDHLPVAVEKVMEFLKKGATLSDKFARNEFGLTQEEIIEGIEDGKLHHRINNVLGNPYYKLIRSEVETFVAEKYGGNYLRECKIKKKLTQTNKNLKKLNTQVASLEQRKAELLANLDDFGNDD
jgi:hypothetical protein